MLAMPLIINLETSLTQVCMCCRGLSEARKDRQAVSRAQAAAEEEALRGWAVDCLRQNARQQKAERERNLKMLTARSLQ
eukprot:557333-Rhodomonas_salina.1